MADHGGAAASRGGMVSETMVYTPAAASEHETPPRASERSLDQKVSCHVYI